jgi:sn-glycerol 3-phosphate transport system substrate-binding protein
MVGFLSTVLAAGGLVAASVAPATAAGGSGASCQVKSLAKATKPVQITFWHSMTDQNAATLEAITNDFNASQSDVKVTLVNQVSYDDTRAKYSAGLQAGDLPDIVQMQETDQQYMIDSQSIVPAGECAKEDKYSFSDFLPRVMSYYTVGGQTYAMPFNTSGPVLYYNKQSFTKAGLDPEKPPATLAEVRSDAEMLKSTGAVSGPPLGLKVEPGYVEHWLGLSSKPYVNNSNGRKARATSSMLDSPTGKQLFSWMGGMVSDGLASTNPLDGPSIYDDLVGIATGNHAMAIDTSAALTSINTRLSSFPNVTLGVAPMPGLVTGKGGVLVSGGANYIVKNTKSPEKQAAAWKYLKYLDDTETQAKWAVGSGYMPIRKSTAASPTMTDYWAKNPFARVAYDQLLNGPVNSATAGSVIGDYRAVRAAVIDGENAMFLAGKDPAAAVKDAATASTKAMKDYNQRLGVG